MIIKYGNTEKWRGVILIVCAVILGQSGAFISGTGTPEPPAAAKAMADTSGQQVSTAAPGVPEYLGKALTEKFSAYDGKLPLWAIQPGTAPRMRQLTESFNFMWFAAQAGNWDYAGFEVYRAGEEVKPIPVVRPARKAMMEAWAGPHLKALAEAVKAKDKPAFEKAYDSAVAGCNACHGATEGGGFPMKSIKITRPVASLFPNIDFKGN